MMSRSTQDAPIRLSGARYDEPVGKSFHLDPEGTLVKINGQARSKPAESINLAFDDADEAFEFILAAGPETILFAGTFEKELVEANVVTKKVREKARTAPERDDLPDLVAASKEHLDFRPGPAIMTIDIDAKRSDEAAAIWPDAPTTFATCPEVDAAVLDLLPEAEGCPRMVVASSSALIVKEKTGELLRGPGGWHVHLPVADGRGIPRLQEIVHQRAWARGKHRSAFVDGGGRIQFRSPADQALRRPTQPIYLVPELGEGLALAVGGVLRLDLSGPLLDPGKVNLTDADRTAAARAMNTAREALGSVAKAKVQENKALVVRKLTSLGVPNEAAERAGHLRFDRGILAGSDEVTFDDGTIVRVQDLLGPRGRDHDNALCLDPRDAEYDNGRAVGKFYWNGGVGPMIHSFAHGSRTYRLAHDELTLSSAIQDAKTDRPQIVRALANAEVDPVVYTQAETAAAKSLGLGVKRKPLQDEVDRLRAGIAVVNEDDATDPLVDVPLDQPLPRHSFPFAKVAANNKYRVLDHADNVRHIVQAYGLQPVYNVISKEVECTGVVCGSGDNKGTALHSLQRSLCALNEVPTENFDTHFAALADENAWNPVVEVLQALVWDGTPRFERWSRETAPRDPKVASIAARIALIQAVAAADHAERAQQLNPNARAHFESVIVFQGPQGLGKTKGLRHMLPQKLRMYMKEGLVLDLRDKDTIKAAISCWIGELGELEATFRKSDIAALKAFTSKDMDEIRMPYAPTSSTFRRRTAFFASVNDEHFLADPTGNRRFIPLAVERVYTGWSDEEIDQLWAEAWHRYAQGEQWWATEVEKVLLVENAEQYRAKHLIEEEIEARYQWGTAPTLWSRTTAGAILARESLDRRSSAADVKALHAALERLWKQSGLTTTRGSQLWITGPEGSEVGVYVPGGKNRGWLMPPRLNEGPANGTESVVQIRPQLA